MIRLENKGERLVEFDGKTLRAQKAGTAAAAAIILRVTPVGGAGRGR